jgi:hypothetical protein
MQVSFDFAQDRLFGRLRTGSSTAAAKCAAFAQDDNSVLGREWSGEIETMVPFWHP